MNYFVYVVCGAKEYIDQLNFSLKYLRYFSDFPILVVTDCSRNEVQIEHDQIIDVKTPDDLNNHQAHLYIETSLLSHLKFNSEDVFCYIDSDIVAINHEINQIFSFFSYPITFSKDHCNIDYFSPKIMNCNCIKEFDEKKRLFINAIDFLPKIDLSIDSYEKSNKLKNHFDELKTKPLRNLKSIQTYLFKRYVSYKKEFTFYNFRFSKIDYCWYDLKDNIILYDFYYYNKLIYKKIGLRYNGKFWVNSDNQVVKPEMPCCTHLRDYLNETYNISIPNNFQHWNGGVFLFNKSSEEFMNYWHKITLKESSKGIIKFYDDQSALIVSSIKFKSIQKVYLPIKYNLIVDFDYYTNSHVKFDKSYDSIINKFNPAFLHIYHHWGDETWDIWKSIIALGKELKIID